MSIRQYRVVRFIMTGKYTPLLNYLSLKCQKIMFKPIKQIGGLNIPGRPWLFNPWNTHLILYNKNCYCWRGQNVNWEESNKVSQETQDFNWIWLQAEFLWKPTLRWRLACRNCIMGCSWDWHPRNRGTTAGLGRVKLSCRLLGSGDGPSE